MAASDLLLSADCIVHGNEMNSVGALEEKRMLHCSALGTRETARGDKETCVCANKAWASTLKDALVTPKLEIGNMCGQKQRRWKGAKTNYYYQSICGLGYLYNVLNLLCRENVCHTSEHETLPYRGIFRLRRLVQLGFLSWHHLF